MIDAAVVGRHAHMDATRAEWLISQIVKPKGNVSNGDATFACYDAP